MYIQTPPSPASEFVLEEENGLTLTLMGRFLPYRPMRIEGRQRAEFTWYPGSPEATVQMLGPEEGTIRLNGYWKDKFLGTDGNDATVEGRPLVGGLPLISISNIAELVQTVDNMRRMGRRITLNWQGLRRVGHIISFAHTWHNVHDCEWEIEFAVLSQGEATVPSVSEVAISLPDVYAEAVKLALKIQQTIINASQLPDLLSLASTGVTALEAAQLIIRATAGALGDVARGYASLVISLSQGVRGLVSSLTGAIPSLMTQANSIADSATAEWAAWGPNGNMDNAPVGVQLTTAIRQQQAARDIRQAGYALAATRRSAALQAAGDAAQIRTLIPPNDTDLRTISNQLYGTADYWQDLMVYNGLNNSTVPRGRTLNIPPVTAFSDRDTTRGY